jgi:hypothetical protein
LSAGLWRAAAPAPDIYKAIFWFSRKFLAQLKGDITPLTVETSYVQRGYADPINCGVEGYPVAIFFA